MTKMTIYPIHLKENGKKIYVDPEGEEGVFLYPGEIKRERLREKEQITGEELEMLRQKYAIPRARKRALGILVKKDCTEKELRDKLTASLHDSVSVENAMDFVRKQGYVDDENYAREYLAWKRGKKSFRQIRQELKRKGIGESILCLLFEECEEQGEDDLRPHIQKYIRRFPEWNKEAWQKTCAHFYRKGYAADLIQKILAEEKQD